MLTLRVLSIPRTAGVASVATPDLDGLTGALFTGEVGVGDSLGCVGTGSAGGGVAVGWGAGSGG